MISRGGATVETIRTITRESDVSDYAIENGYLTIRGGIVGGAPVGVSLLAFDLDPAIDVGRCVRLDRTIYTDVDVPFTAPSYAFPGGSFDSSLCKTVAVEPRP